MRNKISIIGAGNVGASCAVAGAGECSRSGAGGHSSGRDDAGGKSLDLLQAGPIIGYNSRVVGTANGSYDGTEHSDLIIITGGLPRKPGMSREDLVGANQQVITNIIDNALPRSPSAIVIVVTNPLDTMMYLGLTSIPNYPRVVLSGKPAFWTVRASRLFVAQELNVAIENVQTVVMGGHGDEMVPLTRYSTVFGVPLTEWLTADKLNAIVERTRKGGGEIVNLLKTSAYYAPGAALAKMAIAVLTDQKLIVPCSAYLEGEYGQRYLFRRAGETRRWGIEQIIGSNSPTKRRPWLKVGGIIRETMKALK
jgi:malate dehydrogenase